MIFCIFCLNCLGYHLVFIKSWNVYLCILSKLIKGANFMLFGGCSALLWSIYLMLYRSLWACSILQGWEYGIWCFTSSHVGFCWASACNSSPTVSGRTYCSSCNQIDKLLFLLSLSTIFLVSFFYFLSWKVMSTALFYMKCFSME